MALLGPSTDYSDKDFDALRLRLRNLITSAFPEWTDEDVANFGNILVEMLAFVGDVLTKYQDNQAGEAYLLRATQRKNVLALCKLIGFTPRGNTAALVDLVLTLSPAPTGTLTIPERARARTDAIVDPVLFETIASTTLPAGGVGPYTIRAENAERKSETFASTSKPNQELRLASRPYLDDSLVIVAAAGAFTQVDNFLDSAASDKHFTVVVDSNDRATVRFGNGVNGAIPTGTITATYKIGGGASGFIEPNTIKRFDNSFVDSLGNSIAVTVTNPERSTRATNRQTVDEIKVLAPESLRATDRSVAREDFEIHALEVPTVLRALMLTSDQEAGIAENSGILFIVPQGLGEATDVTKDAVLAKVTTEYPHTLTFRVTVSGAVYLTVNIDTTVWFKPGVSTTAAKQAVRDAIVANLVTAFDPANADNVGIDFGYNLRDENDDPAGSIAWSDLFDVVRDTTGVRKIDAGDGGLLLNGASEDLVIQNRQYPILGTVIVRDGSTGQPV